MEPDEIRLVCGLGNPGPNYEHTRHNAGFAVVDTLAGRWGVRYWKSESGCLVSQTSIAGHEVLLAKPQDFMNTSGGPLSKLMRAEHITGSELLVVHDEVDLPAGCVRAKWGGGLNAHNGLRSIAAKLGTTNFSRVRVGIGRPPGRMSVADYALRQLKGSFLKEFELDVGAAADLVEECLSSGVMAAIAKEQDQR